MAWRAMKATLTGHASRGAGPPRWADAELSTVCAVLARLGLNPARGPAVRVRGPRVAVPVPRPADPISRLKTSHRQPEEVA
jgi:hypothetical protein